jgi:hypothetical protein
VRLAVTDDEVLVQLQVQHVPTDETGGRIHITRSEPKPLGQPFSMDLNSFGQVLKVGLRYMSREEVG